MTVKAEKGDLIRITEDVNERIKKGDIYQVENVNSDETAFYDMSGTLAYVFDNEYVIHRKVGEEDNANPHQEYFAEPMGAEVGAADSVNSPNHYTQGDVEVIDIIAQITRGYTDGFHAYCVGNALKYLARAPYKHATIDEDVRKAAKYIEFITEDCR